MLNNSLTRVKERLIPFSLSYEPNIQSLTSQGTTEMAAHKLGQNTLKTFPMCIFIKYRGGYQDSERTTVHHLKAGIFIKYGGGYQDSERT